MMLQNRMFRCPARALCFALWAVLSAVACSSESSDAPTQIVVTVDSDLAVPGELDTVRIQVVGHGKSDPADADLRKQGLPRTLGLVHDSGPLGPLTIRASGLLDGKVVIEKEVLTSFVEHSTSLLTIELESACKGLFCGDGLTCEHGTCVSTPVVGGMDGDGDDAGPIDLGDAGQQGQPDGGEPPAGDAGAGDPGSAPTCTIALPAEGDAYQVGKKFPLEGSCTDPESGAVLNGLSWNSNIDGALATGARADGTLGSAGDHQLTLCARDPRDGDVSGCAMVTVRATTTPQPTATITSVSQQQSTNDPFDINGEIALVGEGSGAGVTLSWRDNIQGDVGDGAEQALATPEVGRHKVELIATDRNGVRAVVSREFVVLANGQSSLVQEFTTANATLSMAGGASVGDLSADQSGRAYAASEQGPLYTFDPSDDKSDATVAIDTPPLRAVVKDVDFAESAGLVYAATADGLTVCNYVMALGIGALCTTYSGSDFPSDDLRSVLRVRGSDDKDHLLVGTVDGLFIPQSLSGDDQGTTKFEGRRINAIAGSNNLAWLATDKGLIRFNPASNLGIFVIGNGAPTVELSDVTVDATGKVWVSSGVGLARLTVSDGKWQSYDTDDGLPTNHVNAVAVARVSVDGDPRDVVWAATDAGLARFDPGYGSFVTFTTADGLPSAKVLDVLVLADGTKLIGTDAGIAVYTGR